MRTKPPRKNLSEDGDDGADADTGYDDITGPFIDMNLFCGTGDDLNPLIVDEGTLAQSLLHSAQGIAALIHKNEAGGRFLVPGCPTDITMITAYVVHHAVGSYIGCQAM